MQIPLAYGPFQQLYEKGVYELAFNEAMSELPSLSSTRSWRPARKQAATRALDRS